MLGFSRITAAVCNNTAGVNPPYSYHPFFPYCKNNLSSYYNLEFYALLLDKKKKTVATLFQKLFSWTWIRHFRHLSDQWGFFQKIQSGIDFCPANKLAADIGSSEEKTFLPTLSCLIAVVYFSPAFISHLIIVRSLLRFHNFSSKSLLILSCTSCGSSSIIIGASNFPYFFSSVIPKLCRFLTCAWTSSYNQSRLITSKFYSMRDSFKNSSCEQWQYLVYFHIGLLKVLMLLCNCHS